MGDRVLALSKVKRTASRIVEALNLKKDSMWSTMTALMSMQVFIQRRYILQPSRQPVLRVLTKCNLHSHSKDTIQNEETATDLPNRPAQPLAIPICLTI